MLKPVIYLSITAGNISKHITKQAHPLVYKTELVGSKVIDLVAYPYSDASIVTSAAVKKALLKLQKSKNHMVFLGWDFTIEARGLISNADVTLFAKENFGWSDERWFAITG